MLSLLAACAWLAAAEPVPPVPAHVFSNDTPVALVAGEKLAEVSFVAAHCFALQRHLEFALNLPPVPPPLARLEVADIAGFAPLETRVGAGTVLVVVRLGDGLVAPGRAAEAAARAWLARVALVAGKPATVSEPWARQALACEVIAQLRPSMNDYWYHEGRQAIPATLADIVAGKAPDREAFLFWRALRQTLGSPAEQSKALIASAHGVSVLKLLADVGQVSGRMVARPSRRAPAFPGALSASACTSRPSRSTTSRASSSTSARATNSSRARTCLSIATCRP
jgi:hypothetical protein